MNRCIRVVDACEPQRCGLEQAVSLLIGGIVRRSAEPLRGGGDLDRCHDDGQLIGAVPVATVVESVHIADDASDRVVIDRFGRDRNSVVPRLSGIHREDAALQCDVALVHSLTE
ncbi:hypothetical protein ACFFX0_30545 [Citricoccus parietis]|uniref:Uncharacterized protein n=1 Tax=Citricoccus parietis TaxID=592307 RepID=A0ABV5G8K1_9MICC